MITGDYGLTAQSIAHKIGMVEGADKLTIITVKELSEIDLQLSYVGAELRGTFPVSFSVATSNPLWLKALITRGRYLLRV